MRALFTRLLDLFRRNELENELSEHVHRIYHMENDISRLTQVVELKEIENERLLNDITELSEYVKELETSLAEAALMTSDLT